MIEILNPLLTLLLNYGYPIIVIVILIGYLGVPIPAEALLLAAGSFSSDNTLNLFIVIGLVLFTALLGDSIMYFLGKKYGYLIASRFGLSGSRITKIEKFLEKWGFWCIFITRWLLTPLSIPVNLVAGTTKYPFKKFFTSALLGESLWTIVYTYLGYIFGANWQSLLDYINDTPLLIVSIFLGITALIIAIRSIHHKTT